jgi:hypothetical protein
MKTMALATAAAMAAATSSPTVTVHVRPEFEAISSVEGKFSAFKGWFRKSYPTLGAEARALAAFVENEAAILEHNARHLGYTLGHNQFSDLTWHEFKAQYVGGYLASPDHGRPKNYLAVAANATANATAEPIDWVAKGGVTPVKNQGQCGSCWTFSTTGALEGALFAATGSLVSLSEQELVSCDSTDSACSGGLMDNAFDWVKANGLSADATYPYTSGDTNQPGTCRDAATRVPVAACTGHADVPPKDEEALLAALRSGPVSVAIEADRTAFQLYRSGILDNSACGTELDHGVLLVGFGYDDTDAAAGNATVPYWKVKNSWGGSWGEGGFIRFAKGKDQCGISQSASQPTGVTRMAPPPAPSDPAVATPGPAADTTAAPAAPTEPAAAASAAAVAHSAEIPRGGAGYYGDPFLGACQAGEANVTVAAGRSVLGGGGGGSAFGAACAPACTGRLFGRDRCPAAPTAAGATAAAHCALRDEATGAKYCARVCSPTAAIADQRAADAACGSDGHAVCQAVSGTAVCVYV